MGIEQTFAKLILAGTLAATVSACGSGDSEDYSKADLKINEVMSKNSGAYADPSDGSFPDWIEIYNRGAEAVSLVGFKIGDAKNVYALPEGVGSIAPKGFVLFFADDSADAGPFHLPFKFSGSGDSAVLTTPDDRQLDKVTIPASGENQTFARFPDGADGALVMCPAYTPGKTNYGSCEEETVNAPPTVETAE